MSTYAAHYGEFVNALNDLKECQIKGVKSDLDNFERGPESENDFTVPFGVILPTKITRVIITDELPRDWDHIEKTRESVGKYVDKFWRNNPEKYERFNSKYAPVYNTAVKIK